MRILYFTRDYTTHDRRFLVELAKTEHQVFFLRLERRGHTLEDRPLPEGIQGIDWIGGRRPIRQSYLPNYLDNLKAVIARVHPDLIQAGPLQSCAYLIVRIGFHPLVSVSWGWDLLIEAERTRRMRRLTRYVLGNSDVLVGDCDTVRQKAITLGMPDERIVTFPWGVDLDQYLWQSDSPYVKTGDQTEVFTLLATRNWEKIYGVDVLALGFARAVELLRQTQGDEAAGRLRLVMLGHGSQAKLIKKTFTQAGIEAQVSFPGHVNQEELIRHFASADLYVSASHSDGTSISLLEAMASGRAVLVSDIPGNREWVNQDTGWLFPDGDIEALAQGILTAMQDRLRLAEMGRAGRRLAEQRADWKKNFAHLLKAYELAASQSLS